MIEIWKPIPSYENLYEASSLGRVRSIDREVTTFSARSGKRVPLQRKGLILSQNVGPHGYYLVCLSKDGKAKTQRVNRLICSAFHGFPPEGYLACHNDGNRLNNSSSNLRWGTPTENQLDRVSHGTHLRGAKITTSRLTEADVAEIIKSPTYSALKCVRISKSQYYRIKNGKSWAHLTETIRGGYLDPANDRRRA